MCNFAVSLIGAELERNGIATVAVSLLKEVTSIIKPPRALFVPFPLGFPLGEPNNPTLQNSVICESLKLLSETDAPVLRDSAF